jgi:hypothetical protein
MPKSIPMMRFPKLDQYSHSYVSDPYGAAYAAGGRAGKQKGSISEEPRSSCRLT